MEELQRILLGDQPPLFLLEIVGRTLIVYLYTLLLLRWLGSRTIGQLSTVEFLLVIALGSAVGDAMFYPDVPLLHALLVVTVVVVANKLLDIFMARSKRAERLLDGTTEAVLSDGVISTRFLNRSTLGLSELSQQLRHRGIEHLGQVARAYVEPDGVITVYKAREERPGLPIVPPWEVEPPPEIRAGDPATGETLSCLRCGTLAEPEPRQTVSRCPHCQHRVWTPARVKALYHHD